MNMNTSKIQYLDEQRMLHFIGTCVELNEHFIQKIDVNAKDIKYKTFRKYFNKEDFKELIDNFSVHPAKDWHVSFQKSKIKNKIYLILYHSRIHHIWEVTRRKG